MKSKRQRGHRDCVSNGRRGAKQFLLYKLGEAIDSTSYEEILLRRKGAWPVEFLSNDDIKFLGALRAQWHQQPRLNSITTLLGNAFVEMNDQGVSLELVPQDVDIRAYIGFVSLRT